MDIVRKHTWNLAYISIFIQACAALFSGSQPAPRILTDASHGTITSSGLVSRLQTPLIEQPEIYRKAYDILLSLESAPSCNRVATASLLSSCQSLEGSPKESVNGPKQDWSTESRHEMENLKSLYAARLAVCELTGAGAAVPLQCHSLIPDPRIKGIPHEFQEGKQLGQCLQALETRPQWWTSYSNGRQNAAVMCQAARIEIDKDEILRIHHLMVDLTSDLTSGAAQVLQTVRENLQDQEKFAESLRSFQLKTLHDLETMRTASDHYFGNTLHRIQVAIDSMLGRVKSSGDAAEERFQNLDEAIQRSQHDVDGLQKNVGKVFQNVLVRSTELAAMQAHDWEQSHAAALGVQLTLSGIQGQEMSNLLNALTHMQEQLHTSTELIALIYARQGNLDERIFKLDGAFENLENRARSLKASQDEQAVSQVDLHDAFRTNMHFAQGLITQVSETTANLHASIEEASVKLQEISVFNGLGTSVIGWVPSVVVIFGIALVSKRAAGLIAIVAGLCIIVNNLGVVDFVHQLMATIEPIHSPSRFAINRVSTFVFLIISAAGSVFLGASLINKIYRRRLKIPKSSMPCFADELNRLQEKPLVV